MRCKLNPTRQQFVQSVTQRTSTGTAKPNRGRCSHALINGKKVYLEIHGRQRWKCKHCGRTFTQELEIIKPRSRLTRYAKKVGLVAFEFDEL